MHDPMTVAFDIRIPKFWQKKRHGIRPNIGLLTIWHVDPEKDGDENSCDWHGSHFNEHWVAELDQLPEDARRAVMFMWWMFHDKLRPRAWWRHPKLHVHHWQLQIHLIQRFKRWAFSRCSKCGERFTWKDCSGNVIGTWSNDGPAWFKNGENIRHMNCDGQCQEEAA